VDEAGAAPEMRTAPFGGARRWAAEHPRALTTIAYAAVALVASVAAFVALFSGFAFYDDEGTLLIAVKAFADGQVLYRDIYAAYGPFFFDVFGGFFALTGIAVTNDASRLVVGVVWIVTSVLFGLGAQRLTGRLVLGAAGGVGIAAIEIGKILGLRVIACASSDDKLAVCREHGADETINYASGNLRDRVKELTGGKGVDVVCDPVGGPYTESALRATAWGGRLLVIGFAAGDIPKIPINLALLQERSIVGVYWGESVKHDPEGHLRNVKQLMEWFAAGKVRPSISERVPLSEAAAVMKRLVNRQVRGKIVLLPED